MKKPRQKKCKFCGELFQPDRPIQPCCSIRCAIGLAEQKKQQKKKKDLAIRKREFLENDIKHQKNLAQKAFNAYIRKRDEAEPCISCQRHHKGQYHAGHYRTTAAAPNLRFNEDNCHKQCSVCNNHLSGNITEYRINLVKKIGIERVEALETNNEVKKWTVGEYAEIKKLYTKKLNDIGG